MNYKTILLTTITCILIISFLTLIIQTSFNENKKEQAPFYVGVTYGGNTVKDAKTLIDKVANYTNLFVLASGLLKDNSSAVNEVGDYAISKGLHFAAYFDVSGPAQNAKWIGTAKQRWGNMFAGVYFGDEPGGKMLDGSTTFNLPINYSGDRASSSQGITVVKSSDGSVNYYDGSNLNATFFPDGQITIQKNNETFFSELDPNNSSVTVSTTLSNTNLTTYEPDGSITVKETITSTITKVYTGGLPFGHYDAGDSYQVLMDNFYTMENGSNRIAQEETYQQITSKNPIPDNDTAANLFVNATKAPIDNLKNQLHISSGDFPIFTSDYGLYWWDYKSGYDMVLAQLGWNNSVAQEIALVRGAANLQGKSWGTILTWKYTQAPYLADGDTIFNEMKNSYENGAQYVILFNYAQGMTGPYGILQEEHFQALEHFWNEVVHNSTVIHGGIKPQAVLVLPKNYAWGMRNPNDRIWGIWEPNSAAIQTWNQVQSKLEQYGTKLDIVYSDSVYPATGRYAKIYSLNT